MHCDRGVAQYRLRARSANFEVSTSNERVLEGVELPVLFLVIYLQITDGARAARAPVDQVVGAVY